MVNLNKNFVLMKMVKRWSVDQYVSVHYNIDGLRKITRFGGENINK